MTKNNNDTESIKEILEKIPGVKSVGEIVIKDKIIERVIVEKELMGKLIINRLQAEDAPVLFNFYFQGLSEKSRIFFGNPYPLFSSPLSSAEELSKRITDWQKEDDWVVFTLVKNKKIIGISLLKRFKTARPVSGIAVRDEFHKKGLGTLLQTMVNEQTRLLNLKKLWSGAAQNNAASLLLHEKCGFKKTSKLTPHFIYKNGNKIIDRYDVEMVKDMIN